MRQWLNSPRSAAPRARHRGPAPVNPTAPRCHRNAVPPVAGGHCKLFFHWGGCLRVAPSSVWPWSLNIPRVGNPCWARENTPSTPSRRTSLPITTSARLASRDRLGPGPANTAAGHFFRSAPLARACGPKPIALEPRAYGAELLSLHSQCAQLHIDPQLQS